MNRTGGRAVFTFRVSGSLGRPIVPDQVGHWAVVEGVDTAAGCQEARLTAQLLGAARYEMVTRVELVEAEV